MTILQGGVETPRSWRPRWLHNVSQYRLVSLPFLLEQTADFVVIMAVDESSLHAGTGREPWLAQRTLRLRAADHASDSCAHHQGTAPLWRHLAPGVERLGLR